MSGEENNLENNTSAENQALETPSANTAIGGSGAAVPVGTQGNGGDPPNTNIRSQETDYKSSGRSVVLLGLYLVLMLILSIYLLFTMMKAKRGSDVAIANTNTNQNQIQNTNTDENSNANQDADTNVNVNAAVNSATNVNSNVNGVNNAGTNARNTNVKPPANTVNGNKPANTNKPAAASPTPKQNFYEERDIPKEVSTNIFGNLTADSFVFLVVLFAGMMGALIRGVHSFFKHLGLGDFSFKWTWFYLLLPFSGAALSVIIYLVIRGGFYTSSYGEGLELNVFSFAAFAALTGLFSDNAIEKLRQVAKVILADVPPKVENAKEILDKKKSDQS